ncbi:MAG: queuosine precursor transporter [Deltaproteobacteria bacterium]|nr:queuosine precursor transporter [Deltaproteobacteria bacterium]
MAFDNRLRLYLVLMAAFVTALVVGDIIGGKLTQVVLFGHPFTISVGMIPFPLTFLLTDLLNEFYGSRAARNVTWIGFGMALFTFSIISVAVLIPFAPFTFAGDWGGINQRSFDNVFAGAQRIFFASMVAYLIGQLVDIGVFHALKTATQNRQLWLRATGSTAVSQALDTIVIQTLAWAGTLPISEIANIAVSSYVVKLAVAIGLTPLIYAGHVLLERWLSIHPVVLDENGQPIDAEAHGS